jgi:hypothetical protein
VSGPPVMTFAWDGEAMKPLLPRLADRHFVVGEKYPLEVREDRSVNSHRHFFAAVNEAFQNLPERVAERFASPEHLRRFALIMTGHRDERAIVCASHAEALKTAAVVKALDDYSVTVIDGALVTVLTAKSQSQRAMDKRTFQKSKDDVLGYIAGMIGTTAAELQQSEAA